VLRLFALPPAILLATILFGSKVLVSDVSNRPAPAPAPAVVWTPETGAYLGTTSVQCLLVPNRECHAVLSDGGQAAASARPQVGMLGPEGADRPPPAR
jgi:hypothetical protein